MDGKRMGKQCQVRNAEPVSMEQLFVIRRNTHREKSTEKEA